jgi:hypothetical protein
LKKSKFIFKGPELLFIAVTGEDEDGVFGERHFSGVGSNPVPD